MASTSERGRGWLVGWTLFWILGSAFAMFLPPRGPLGDRPEEFSVERALEHVRALAREPRPSGSEANDAARAHIVDAIRALGLEPEIQSTEVDGVVLENVVVTLEGTEPGAALLLLAHYDSRPETPGAGDDAAGTAVLLETLRALRAGPPLANDVVFLVTDGEELGMLGAEAFAREHPLFDSVGLVLNFEALGNAGPAVLFETGTENGWFIAEFARAAAHPVGSSLGKSVYERMPNDTDYSCFRDRGVPGLNFALCCGTTAYHGPADTVENLSRSSLAHHGSNALTLARHFGALDLGQREAPDAIFFNVLGPVFIQFSSAWALPVAVVLLVVTLGGAWRFVRRSAETRSAFVVSGLLVVPLTVLVGGTVAGGVWIADVTCGAVGRTLAERALDGNVLSAALAFAALATGVVVAWTTVARFLCAPRVEGIAWWGRLLIGAFGLVLAVVSPGASYAVLGPVAGSLIVRGRALLGALGVLPTALLCTPAALFVFMIASRALVPALFAMALVLAAIDVLLVEALRGASRRVCLLGGLLAVVLAAAGGALRGAGL